MKNFVDAVHKWGKRVVVMLYAGFSKDSEHVPAEAPLILNGTEKFEGQTLSGTDTVFLDWFDSAASDPWEKGLFKLWETVPFDGLWLAQNAPSIMCDGGHPNCDDDKPTPPGRKLVADDDNTDWYSSSPDQSAESTYNLPFMP